MPAFAAHTCGIHPVHRYSLMCIIGGLFFCVPVWGQDLSRSDIEPITLTGSLPEASTLGIPSCR